MSKIKLEVLKAGELAKLLGLSLKTIYHAAKESTIPALRVGRRWLFPKKAIYQWLKTGKKPKTIAKSEEVLQTPKALPLFE